ncbi:uncharacterized protein METZ01_LOCUS72001, partial [marine metagenome]
VGNIGLHRDTVSTAFTNLVDENLGRRGRGMVIHHHSVAGGS